MIPLVDLARQHKPLKSQILKRISAVIDESTFTQGKDIGRFEKNFAKYIGVKYAIGTGNCSDALRLAVLALGIGKSDEVITVANTFVSTADAIVHAGATPVFVDCDEYFGIDTDQIEAKITKNTKALIPVHLYGQACDMAKILLIAKKHKLAVIEDCAQAHGAEYNGKKVGAFGDIACFSFYPGKNLGAMGDGGIALTNSKSLATKLSMLREFGQTEKYYHQFSGFNSALDNLQAAVLDIKLKHLDKWNTQRITIARSYTKQLTDSVEVPRERPTAKHVYHLYVIKTKNRNKLLNRLHSKKVFAGMHYPVPVPFQEAYRYLGHKRGDFPNAELNSKTMISLPIFPGMTHAEIDLIAREVRNFVGK